MNNQKNDQRKRPHHQEKDQKQPPQEKQEPKQPHLQELIDQEQEQEEDQDQDQEQEQDEEEQDQEQKHNHSISNHPPHNMHSSPPPKPPPPKPPSPLLDKDSKPDSTHSSDHHTSHGYDSTHSSDHHTSHGYNYAFSSPQLNQAKYQIPPPDQTSQSYVFSSSPDVKSAKATSRSPSPPPEAPSIPMSKTQDEDIVQKPVVDGISGGSRRKPKISISERKKENMMKKALLGFRFLALVFCLVSFSIMAADKNQGWALDSFNSYKEFRYCLSVNVMGFVYSGLQVYDLAYSLATGKHVARNQLRYFLDFTLDQILTYFLLSASSSAVFRVEDWESNWGSDKFPAMARSSVILSFLAFVAFALCSLVSGHTLFTPKSV